MGPGCPPGRRGVAAREARLSLVGETRLTSLGAEGEAGSVGTYLVLSLPVQGLF